MAEKKLAEDQVPPLGAVGTKNPPIDADKALYRDSEDSDALKTSTWAQVKAFFKTYFDTLYGPIKTTYNMLLGLLKDMFIDNTIMMWDGYDMFIDAFNDESDQASLIGLEYIGGTDYYAKNTTDGVNDYADGIVTVNWGPASLANLTDGNTGAHGGSYTLDDTGGSVGFTFPAAVTLSKIRFYSFAATERVKHFKIERYNGGVWTKVPITGVADNASLVTTDEGQASNANGWNTVTFTPVADTQFRITFYDYDGGANQATWNIGDANAAVSEIQMFNEKGILVTNAHTLSGSLSGNFYMVALAIDADDDIVYELSANGGVNYTTIPLTDVGVWSGSIHIYVGKVAIGTAGSSLQARVSLPDDADQLYGIGVMAT